MILTTILSGALGLLGSSLPEIASYFQTKASRNHQLEMLKFQASSDKAAALVAKDVAASEALSEELKAIYRDASTSKSYRWVDAIYKLTRPSITLLIASQWALVNVAEMVWFTQQSGDWTSVTQAWSEYDQAIMSAVIMFWFGHRANMRTNGRAN